MSVAKISAALLLEGEGYMIFFNCKGVVVEW